MTGTRLRKVVVVAVAFVALVQGAPTASAANETFTSNDSVGLFLEAFLGKELVEKQIALEGCIVRAHQHEFCGHAESSSRRPITPASRSLTGPDGPGRPGSPIRRGGPKRERGTRASPRNRSCIEAP
jgi:hypothetical protein